MDITNQFFVDSRQGQPLRWVRPRTARWPVKKERNRSQRERIVLQFADPQSLGSQFANRARDLSVIGKIVPARRRLVFLSSSARRDDPALGQGSPFGGRPPRPSRSAGVRMAVCESAEFIGVSADPRHEAAAAQSGLCGFFVSLRGFHAAAGHGKACFFDILANDETGGAGSRSHLHRLVEAAVAGRCSGSRLAFWATAMEWGYRAWIELAITSSSPRRRKAFGQRRGLLAACVAATPQSGLTIAAGSKRRRCCTPGSRDLTLRMSLIFTHTATTSPSL